MAFPLNQCLMQALLSYSLQFGAGGVRSFVKFKKKVHPIIDSLPDKYAINFLCCLVEHQDLKQQ